MELATKVGVDLGNFNLDACFWRLFYLLLLIGSRLAIITQRQVTVLTNKLTNKQTPLKTSTSLRYATLVVKEA